MPALARAVSGRHFLLRFGQVLVERHKLTHEFKSTKSLEIFLQDANLMKLVDVIDVGDKQIALHYADDHFQKVIKPGKAAFFNTLRKNRFELIDFTNPEIPDSVSASVLAHAELTPYLQVVNLNSFEKSMLFFNGNFIRLLEPGKYYFWTGPTKVTGQSFDMRQQQLYILLQLILREYVGMLRLDEMLEKKEEIGQFILEKLQKNAGDWGLEFLHAGVKDVILPGEIKDILNKVIEAEKRAQANVITRREETASTRSLLNTVKLMEDNPLLIKLKEWEYIEAIASKVNSISVSSGADLMQQLGKLLAPGKAQ